MSKLFSSILLNIKNNTIKDNTFQYIDNELIYYIVKFPNNWNNLEAYDKNMCDE